MLNRKFLFVLSAFVVTAIAAVLVGVGQQAQNLRAKDEPTQFVEGAMTEKQKKHSKLYRQPEKARSLIKKVNRDVTAIIGEPSGKEDVSPDGILPTQEEYLPKLVCNSPTILLGRVKAKSSHFSEDDKSIFTDYQLKITTIYKDSSDLNLETGNIVMITRSGGSVRFDGHVFSVFDKSYRLLKVGQTYLLFLDYLKDTESFKPNSVEGTFEIKDSSIRRFNDTSPKYQLDSEMAFDSFLTHLSSLTCVAGDESK